MLRFAIAGLGNAARAIHLPALRKIKEAVVVGGYDAAAGATGLPFPTFASLEAMLEAARPDVLVVATPPQSHFALAEAGLAAGCHVFCEKPVTETLAQADRLAELAGRVGRHVVVNSEFPWMPIHQAAKARMQAPGFGDLKFVRMEQTFVVTAAAEAGWRGGDPRRVLKDFGTHVLDLAMYFFGERPTGLRCRIPRESAASPDHLVLIELTFSRERCAHILLDRLSRGRHRYLDIRLDGAEATIETSIGGRLQATMGLNVRSRRPLLDVDVALGGWARLYRGEAHERLATAPIDLFADATARLLQQAIEAWRRGERPPCDIEHARATLVLLTACYEAAEDGQPRSFVW